MHAKEIIKKKKPSFIHLTMYYKVSKNHNQFLICTHYRDSALFYNRSVPSKNKVNARMVLLIVRVALPERELGQGDGRLTLQRCSQSWRSIAGTTTLVRPVVFRTLRQQPGDWRASLRVFRQLTVQALPEIVDEQAVAICEDVVVRAVCTELSKHLRPIAFVPQSCTTALAIKSNVGVSQLI